MDHRANVHAPTDRVVVTEDNQALPVARPRRMEMARARGGGAGAGAIRLLWEGWGEDGGRGLRRDLRLSSEAQGATMGTLALQAMLVS